MHGQLVEGREVHTERITHQQRVPFRYSTDQSTHASKLHTYGQRPPEKITKAIPTLTKVGKNACPHPSTWENHTIHRIVGRILRRVLLPL